MNIHLWLVAARNACREIQIIYEAKQKCRELCTPGNRNLVSLTMWRFPSYDHNTSRERYYKPIIYHPPSLLVIVFHFVYSWWALCVCTKTWYGCWFVWWFFFVRLGWLFITLSHHCLVDVLKLFRATERSTESVPFVFGVETLPWPMAANTCGKWCRGVVEAVSCFMTRWHLDAAGSRWLRQAAGDTKSDYQLIERGGGGVMIPLSSKRKQKWTCTSCGKVMVRMVRLISGTWVATAPEPWQTSSV